MSLANILIPNNYDIYGNIHGDIDGGNITYDTITQNNSLSSINSTGDLVAASIVTSGNANIGATVRSTSLITKVGGVYQETGSSGTVTIPTNIIMGGIYLYQGTFSGDVVATLPAAADIVALHPELEVGDLFSFLYVYSAQSPTSDSLTLSAGVGGTLSPDYSTTTPGGIGVSNDFTLWGGQFFNAADSSSYYLNHRSLRPLIYMNNVTSGSESYTVYL